jgi:hypothetical protein
LNNPEKTFLALTNVCVEVLPDPDMKWDAPFLAVNKSVVTMVRALKEQDEQYWREKKETLTFLRP